MLAAILQPTPAWADTRPSHAGASVVPPNLQAPPSILVLIERMARVSPTFRGQCERIARARGLVVRIRHAGLREGRPFNARTVVRRYEFGAVIAEMALYAPIDPVEILAHEFEHVVEQIDGWNLRALARVRGSGVIEVARGEFETARAAHAGRRVLAECGALDREFLTLGDGT